MENGRLDDHVASFAKASAFAKATADESEAKDQVEQVEFYAGALTSHMRFLQVTSKLNSQSKRHQTFAFLAIILIFNVVKHHKHLTLQVIGNLNSSCIKRVRPLPLMFFPISQILQRINNFHNCLMRN